MLYTIISIEDVLGENNNIKAADDFFSTDPYEYLDLLNRYR